MEENRYEKISKSKYFFGLKYNEYNINDYDYYMNYVIRKGIKSIIFGYSLILLPRLKTNPDIYYFANNFDFHIIDGRGLYTLMKLFGVNNIIDYSLPDIVNITLDIANKNKYSVLLLGATKEINDKAVKNIKNKYPRIKVQVGIDGYFDRNNTEDILKLIDQLNPDIILIGMSSPEKEKYANIIKSKVKCKIIIPCGGVIDILGGKTKREPLIFKKLNLTWLYRFLQEPYRLFNSIFLNAFKVIFILIPVIFFNYFLLKNKDYSIPKFYGVK